MFYLYIKALHVISVVCWFAGLFYIGRLFVYNAEANQKSEPEKSILKNQFRIMQRRLWYGITWPAMIFTLCFGTELMILIRAYTQPWFHAKLAFVILLLIYHGLCGTLRKRLDNDTCTLTSMQLRAFNEVPIFLLVAIVGIVYLKSFLNVMVGMGILTLLGVLLALGITLYKQVRNTR